MDKKVNIQKSNIHVVDFKKKDKKAAPKIKETTVSLGIFDEEAGALQDIVDFANSAAEIAIEYAIEMADEAGLVGLEFELAQDSAAALLTECSPDTGYIPDLTFTAEDEKYAYSVCLTQGQDEECEEDGEDGICGCGDEESEFLGALIRMDKEKAEGNNAEPYEMFDFEEYAWMDVACMDLFGATPRQMEKYIVREGGMPDTEAMLWAAYTIAYGPVDDAAFERVKRDNKKLTQIADLLPDGLFEGIWFNFTDKKKANLLLSPDLFGTCVQYRNGKYCAVQYAAFNDEGGKPNRTVYATADMYEMAEWLEDVYDRKYPRNTAGVVALSEDALLIIEDEGCYVEFSDPERELLTAEEAKMANAAMADIFGKEILEAIDFTEDVG